MDGASGELFWILGLIPLSAVILALLGRVAAKREPWEFEATPERHRWLIRAYERALRTMKDLEFDLQTGSLSEKEHAELKASYKQRAIALRRELDRHRQAAVRRIAGGKSTSLSGEERDVLEKLVARQRARMKK